MKAKIYISILLVIMFTAVAFLSGCDNSAAGVTTENKKDPEKSDNVTTETVISITDSEESLPISLTIEPEVITAEQAALIKQIAPLAKARL